MFAGSVMFEVGPTSTVEVPWAEGALEASSSSESSELRPFGGISAMIGREGGREVDSGADGVERCFFLWLWIIHWSGSLFGTNRDRCCGSSGRTREIR